MRRLAVAALAALSLSAGARGQTVSDVITGLVDVRQNDAGNDQTSVTLTKRAGATRFSWTDRNRGDFSVGFGTGDDLRSGVIFSCVRNLARNNTSNGDVGGNIGADLHATTATSMPASNIAAFVSVFGAPSGEEMNADVATAFFPFASFVGGYAFNAENNAATDRLVATPGLDLGQEFIDSAATEGIYSLDLRGFGADGSNGVLLVCGAKNEDNFALSRNHGGGIYSIFCKDNGSNGATYENDPVAFVYLPYSTTGLVAGRIAENGGAAPTVLSGTTGFTATAVASGRVLVRITGVTSEDAGVFLVSPECGVSNNNDNIVVADWDDALDGYIVETRDLPGMGLQSMGGEPTFSFAYIPVTAGPGFESRPNTSTLIALPDTQLYAQDYPAVFHAQTQWIANEASARDIDMVIGLGDITNRNTAVQWNVARAAYDRIHLQVPFILAQGNHDVGPNGNGADRTTGMNQFFPINYLIQQPTFGGVAEFVKVENSYSLFEAAGRKWVVLALEWGPRDTVLPWANQVLAAHSDRLAIVVTHAYMDKDDTKIDHLAGNFNGSPYNYGTADGPGGTNDGGDLWRELVSLHPNTVLVLSGHIHGEGRLSEATAFGNVVHQMLADFQSRPEGGEGYLRILELTPDSSTIRVRTYSPWTGMHLTDSGNFFDLELMTAPGYDGRLCTADMNNDGVLDFFDVQTFLTRFAAHDPQADLTGNGSIDFFDVQSFLGQFSVGCP